MYVTLITLVIPRLGLTATTMAVVFSQLIGSLLIDHWGWLAVLLLLFAVALRRSNAIPSRRGHSDG